MRILLTNDDGVFAASLWPLYRELTELGDVTVVAPHTEQSGVGHAITYREPITADRVRVNGHPPAHAVGGTPADCVKFALLHLMPEKPDLVVSGINPGLNLGPNIFYSGTVAAAMEAAMYGVEGVAISCDPAVVDTYSTMAEQALRVLRTIRALNTRRSHALVFNVNLPSQPRQAEIVFTRHWQESFDERYAISHSEADTLYQLELPAESGSPTEKCDVTTVANSDISVTPLRPNLTDTRTLQDLRAAAANPGHTPAAESNP